jgi:hypothetical protein
MPVHIQLRRGTVAAWTAANPILSEGEFGLETDTGVFKIGNGISTWNALPYQALGEISLTPKASSSGVEGTMFYCSTDDHVYVATE